MTYSRNARGETYGSSAFAKSPTELPDLIASFGEDHKTRGFVRKTDLESRAVPRSPEEVEARAASGQTGRVGDKEVPLYAQDRVTVVGSFIVKGWSAGPDATTPRRR